MPHCIIEYSNEIALNTSVSELVESVFIGSKESELFEASQIKVRAIPFESYKVGEGDKRFIHVCARILSGRTIEQKKVLSDGIISRLSQLNLSEVVITVEVIDMERTSYTKLVY